MDFNFSREEYLLKNSIQEYIRDKIIPMVETDDRFLTCCVRQLIDREKGDFE